MGKPGWWSLLLLIPLVNIVILILIARSNPGNLASPMNATPQTTNIPTDTSKPPREFY